MRGRDEETGEFHDKSRSQNRRDALDVLALGEKLVSLTPAQLARLPIPEDLLPHIAECKRITAHIAHKRQLAFLAKHMRRETKPRWMRSAMRWTPTAKPAAAKWR
jgi:ribosome-associated protein